MKYFLIKYQMRDGSKEEWRQEIARVIQALEADPVVAGKISYRAMKHRDGSDYYHLATAIDEEAAKALGQREFFTNYTEAARWRSCRLRSSRRRRPRRDDIRAEFDRDVEQIKA